jgi:hypothetical protein
MTDVDTRLDRFERRLARGLADYAEDGLAQVDAVAFAHAIARDHPRRGAFGSRSAIVRLLAAASLLAATALLGLYAAGAFRDDSVDLSEGPVPPGLLGDWTAVTPGVTVPARRWTGRAARCHSTLDRTTSSSG